jgi:hypothetical protein
VKVVNTFMNIGIEICSAISHHLLGKSSSVSLALYNSSRQIEESISIVEESILLPISSRQIEESISIAGHRTIWCMVLYSTF